MKYITFFVLSQICFSSFSQNSDSQLHSVENDSDRVLVVVEHVPIYRGCDNFKSNSELKKCMTQKILELVSKKFKTDVSKGLEIKEDTVKINVNFDVGIDGNVVNISANGPHPKLEKEALRVINLIPKMKKPAYHKGEPVSISYSLPIKFLPVKD